MPRLPRTRLRVTVNGHTLAGVQRHSGGWTWTCPQCPDVATRYHRDTHPLLVVLDFTAQVLMGGVGTERE